MKLKDCMYNILVSKTGEYASAIKIQQILRVSLPLIYSIVKNEKVSYKIEHGRKKYSIKSLLDVLYTKEENVEFLEHLYTKEERDINNFLNWEPKNPLEEYLQSFLLDELGEFTSTKELVSLFKIGKSTWYEIMERGGIICFYVETRRVVLTRSLLVYLRENFKEKL